MDKNILQQNYFFSLPVWEGEENTFSDPIEKLIGSEIEPIELYSSDNSEPYSQSGVSVEKEDAHIIKQRGKFFVIVRHEDGYDHERMGRQISNSWDAYELPRTIQIDRWVEK